jgi:hypothetical protein
MRNDVGASREWKRPFVFGEKHMPPLVHRVCIGLYGTAKVVPFHVGFGQ